MYKYKQLSIALAVIFFTFLMPQNLMSQNLAFSVDTTSISPNSEVVITNSSTNIPPGYNYRWTFTNLGVNLAENRLFELRIFNNNNSTFSVYTPTFYSSLNETELNIKLELVDNDGELYDITSYNIDIPMTSPIPPPVSSCTEIPFINCDQFDNLVCNGNFEYTTSYPNSYSDIELASPWINIISSDLYHKNGTSFANIPNAAYTSLNLINTGAINKGAGGFAIYYDNILTPWLTNKREYFGQELKSALVPGQQYTIEMDIIFNEHSRYRINSLGVLFTDDMPVSSAPDYMIQYTGGVAHFPKLDVLSIGTTGYPGVWKHLTTTFIAPANSSLDHIVIGNHRTEENTDIHDFNSSTNYLQDAAYYFVDNIKVTPTQNVTTISDEMLEAEISQHNIDELNGEFEYIIENPDPSITYLWEITSGYAADMTVSQGTTKTIDWELSSATGLTLGKIKLTQQKSNCVSKIQEYRVGVHGTPCSSDVYKSEWDVKSQDEVDAITNGINTIYLSGVTNINANIEFSNIVINMAPNAKILLSDNVTFEMEDCKITYCNAMWDGISANKKSEKIVINNSIITNISGAVYGITSRNGADVELSKCNFIHNLNSVQILNHKDNSLELPNTFVNADINIFDCSFNGANITVNLPPPYDSSIPEIGININLVDNIQIGNDTKSSNIFNSLTNGIKIYNSKVNIFNNKFYYISNYLSETTNAEAAITINASNMFNLNTQSSVTIGGDNNKANIFDGCYNSVYSNNSKLLIKNNIFRLGNQSILVHNFRNGSVIENNIFTNIYYGIKIDNLLGTSKKLNISDNYFQGVAANNYLSSVSRCAIELINCNSNYNSSIRTKVENNTIKFFGEKSLENKAWGIRIQNCDGIIVNSNHITRMTNFQEINTDWEYSKGIRISTCQGAQIMDNYIWGFGQSIFTTGDLIATQFSCNELKLHKYGFNWGSSTTLSHQGLSFFLEVNTHNEWVSYPVITDNEKLASGANADNINNTNPINWYHYGNMGSNWIPNTVKDIYLATKILPIVSSTSAIHFCAGGSGNNGSGTSTGGGTSGSGSSNVTSLIESIEDPELRDFMFEDIILGEEYLDLQNEYRAYDADFLYRMLSVDTTMMWLGGDNDADYQSFFDDLKDANIGQFAEVYDLIELGNIEEAIAVNSNITPEQEIFANLKTVLEIYLNTWCRNRYMLTQEEYDVLFSIADQTPYEAGDAVYTARIMIGYEPDDHEVAYRLKENEEHKDENGLILYPNPASDNVTIEFSNDKFENVEAQLKVYSITGKLIYETEFSTINSFKVLSVDMLKNGVYMFQISLSNGIDKVGKLVIIKQ